jgi:hypothetical protein
MADLPRFRFLRPEDLLVVDVEVSNLQLSADGSSLERADPAADAYLIFHFPAQHIAERAFWEAENSKETAGPPPVPALAAGETRLAFKLAPGITSMAFSIESLLDWSALVPSLPGNALPPGAVAGPPPGGPSAAQTAIEFPYRLFLSPDATATWTHRKSVFTSGNRTEIWHSRLTPPRGRPSTPVRAVGRRNVPDRIRTSLASRDLDDLVTLSGDFTIRPKNFAELGMNPAQWFAMLQHAGLLGKTFPPTPIDADEFIISALGATARLRGRWDYPPLNLLSQKDLLSFLGMPTPSMEQYEHIAGQGRDQYVRVVRRGVLHSGHRASVVKVTERRFEPRLVRTIDTPAGHVGIFGTTAYLRQYYQVIVQEPLKRYDELAGGYANKGVDRPFRSLEMPFRTLRYTTLVSPKIDFPCGSPDTIEAALRPQYIMLHPMPAEPQALLQYELDFQAFVQAAVEQQFKCFFWVKVGGADFPFGIVGTDWEENVITFDTPVLFIPYEALGKTDAAKIVDVFNNDPSPLRTQRPIANQNIAIADPTGSKPTSTRLPVETVTFGLEALPANPDPPLPPTYLATWVLKMRSAQVHLESVEQLTGQRDPTSITLSAQYLKDGVGPKNRSGAFADLGDARAVKFSGPSGGGVARPDSEVKVISSKVGAVGKAFVGANPPTKADLAELFGGAKLFGYIKLIDILADMDIVGLDVSFEAADLSEAELAARLADPNARLPIPVLRTRRLPAAVESRFVWKPALKSAGILDLASAELVLDVRTVTPLNGASATSEVRGELRHFALNFFSVLRVELVRLAFSALPGRKPDVTAEGCRLTFQGPLTFVNSLRNVLPDNGFSDPPAVEVTASGISAGYTLGIPSVGVGIVSIENLSLSAMLTVPFNDQPANVRFALSERHHPFIVTVTLFGGGGFFALAVSAKGVEQVEAAIEFGGNVSINLGVASGGVHVMAGIYFSKTKTDVTLTGYLRVGGYLSVLGLITISVEFYLAFAYRKAGGGSEVYGQASVTVTVKVACFSKSVSLTVERSFEGAPGDPTFEDVIDPPDWEQYCLAFASDTA